MTERCSGSLGNDFGKFGKLQPSFSRCSCSVWKVRQMQLFEKVSCAYLGLVVIFQAVYAIRILQSDSTSVKPACTWVVNFDQCEPLPVQADCEKTKWDCKYLVRKRGEYTMKIEQTKTLEMKRVVYLTLTRIDEDGLIEL